MHAHAGKREVPTSSQKHPLEDITFSPAKVRRGLLQIGKEGDRAFNRTTGEGYVAHVDGDYADAARKKIPVILVTRRDTLPAPFHRRATPPSATSHAKSAGRATATAPYMARTAAPRKDPRALSGTHGMPRAPNAPAAP